MKGLKISEDGKTVRLVVDNLRKYCIHETKLGGLESASGTSLLPDVGYYTLNNIPSGPIHSQSEWTRSASQGDSKVTSSLDALDAPADAGGVAEDREEVATVEAKGVVEMPDTWEGGADRTIELGTVPYLESYKGKIEVKAGSRVPIITCVPSRGTK